MDWLGFPIPWALQSPKRLLPPWTWRENSGKGPRAADGEWELPWGHVDVLEEATKPVHQGHTQRTQDGVPVGLHVLWGAPLGVTLAAKIISTRCHDVRDEIIISTRCLENRNKNVSQSHGHRSTAVDWAGGSWQDGEGELVCVGLWASPAELLGLGVMEVTSFPYMPPK